MLDVATPLTYRAARGARVDLAVGLDVGTSAIKGVLADPAGKLLVRMRSPVRFVSPSRGWIEIDPEQHCRSVCDLIRSLASHAGALDRVRALCMSFASGNALLLDEQARPLTNIVSWLDTRAEGALDELLPGIDATDVHRVVGWPLSSRFPLGQLAWLRRHRPDAYRRAARACMNNDYLTHRLAGVWAMDHSTATTFYLQDQRLRAWHEPYLRQLDIPAPALSRLEPCATVLGSLTPQAAADTGLDPETMVVLGAFDHPSAARGTGMFDPGDLLISCGTSWVGFFPTPERERAISAGLLVDPFRTAEGHRDGGPWGAMFSLTAVGETISGLLGSPDERELARLTAEAEQVEPGSGLVDPTPPPAQLHGWSGAFLRDHPRGALFRVLVEGAALEMRRRIDELEPIGLEPRRVTMVGGPSENPLCSRILAACLGRRVTTGLGAYAGAAGAAAIAGVATGLFTTQEEAAAAFAHDAETVQPTDSEVTTYAALYERYRGVCGSLPAPGGRDEGRSNG